MTTKELIDVLSKFPEDSIVMYRHNKYGRIDINKVSIAINELKTVDNKTKKLYADVFKDFIIPSGRMTKEK